MASGVGKAIGKVFKAPIKIAKKVVKTAWDNKELIALAAAAYFTAGAATGAMGGTGFMAGAPGFGSTGVFTQAAGAMGFGPGAAGAAGALPSLAAPGAMTPIAGVSSGLSPMAASGLASAGSSVAKGGLMPPGVSPDTAAMIASQQKMHDASMSAANRSALLNVGGSALSGVGSYLAGQEERDAIAEENQKNRDTRQVLAPGGDTTAATAYYRKFLERV